MAKVAMKVSFDKKRFFYNNFADKQSYTLFKIFSVVAIAFIDDADNPEAGHTYPYDLKVVSENADEITILASGNPNVFLIAYSGERVSYLN